MQEKSTQYYTHYAHVNIYEYSNSPVLLDVVMNKEAASLLIAHRSCFGLRNFRGPRSNSFGFFFSFHVMSGETLQGNGQAISATATSTITADY